MPGFVVVSGAQLHCDKCSGKSVKLAVTDGGFSVENEPVATRTDHISGKNIKPFPGECQTSHQHCNPDTPAPWIPGEVALTAQSCVMVITQDATINCVAGSGVISISNPGQSKLKIDAKGISHEWSAEDETEIEAYIESSLRNNNGDTELSFKELRNQRQNPAFWYDSNLAIAADYLRARWDVQRYGARVERAQVEIYSALKRTVGVPKEGPGPVSPTTPRQRRYMRKGIADEREKQSPVKRMVNKLLVVEEYHAAKAVLDLVSGRDD